MIPCTSFQTAKYKRLLSTALTAPFIFQKVSILKLLFTLQFFGLYFDTFKINYCLRLYSLRVHITFSEFHPN